MIFIKRYKSSPNNYTSPHWSNPYPERTTLRLVAALRRLQTTVSYFFIDKDPYRQESFGEIYIYTFYP